VTSDRIAAAAARLAPLPAVLLVAVAATQIALARTASLSPWSGGGFGMFSSTDTWSRRHLHAWAIRPGLRTELEVPDDLREDERRALALPDGPQLRALAARLAAIEREQGDPDAAPLEAIALQVWRVHYDARTLAPSGEMLAAVEIPAGDE
jgi:hypothetical protein